MTLQLNQAGFPMKVGSDKVTLYCGRNLGTDAIPGSDGLCGTQWTLMLRL